MIFFLKCKGIMLYYFVKINGIPKNGHFGFENFFYIPNVSDNC